MPINKKEIVAKNYIIESFTCDKCHQTVTPDSLDFQEMVHIEFIGGYTSKWGDGTHVEVTLCDQCAFDLLNPFAITE